MIFFFHYFREKLFIVCYISVIHFSVFLRGCRTRFYYFLRNFIGIVEILRLKKFFSAKINFFIKMF